MNKQTQEALKMAIEALEDASCMAYSEFSIENEYEDVINACKEALEQPAQDDDLMNGRWIRFNEEDDTTRLLLELEVAMNGVENSAKSPSVIDVLRQAVDYFKGGKKYHVLPIGDIKPHEESERCECNPAIEMYRNNKVAIHNSFDGREALEQPAQEPVAWIKDWADGSKELVPDNYDGSYPVYTHPAQPLTRDWIGTALERADKDEAFRKGLISLLAQPLSDDEIDKILDNDDLWKVEGDEVYVRTTEFARAIEQAHGIGVKDE